MKAAFHVARHRAAGAGARRRREGRAGGRARLRLSGRRRPARAGSRRSKVHPRQIRAAAEAIAAAERPIVYAGGGVLNADACAELRELVEAGRLPAVVTLMGKGCLPDSHPLNYGAPGMHGSKYANWALNKADLVIAVGSRFDDRVTGKVSAFAPGAKVIHFDIDAAEVGKIRHAEIPVVGPLKLGLGTALGAR